MLFLWGGIAGGVGLGPLAESASEGRGFGGLGLPLLFIKYLPLLFIKYLPLSFSPHPFIDFLLQEVADFFLAPLVGEMRHAVMMCAQH